MGSIKHLPEYESILQERESINRRLFKKIEANQDLVLINDLVDHHIRIDNHVLNLEKMVVELQDRLISAGKIYNELLEEYGEMSEREMSMIKWILKRKINGKSAGKS